MCHNVWALFVYILYMAHMVHAYHPPYIHKCMDLSFCFGSICLDSVAAVGSHAIVPDIMDEYVKIKGMFVDVCTRQGSPTFDEVKDHCIDLIEGVLIHMPRVTRHDDDIRDARTFSELARIVCFRLSKWNSYDFFKKVIGHFQPALNSIQEQLRCYQDHLKSVLLQKLEHIAELQQR